MLEFCELLFSEQFWGQCLELFWRHGLGDERWLGWLNH